MALVKPLVIKQQAVAQFVKRNQATEMTSPSPSRRAERKQRLRGEILAAASKMFADRGYEAVTLREIAQEIGYTHAVIYQHFPDKWHILAELSRETIGLMIRNFDAIAAQHPSPKERLFATSRGLIQFCIAHPQQFRNVFFGPENRNGIRAGQYINDIGAPLFQRFVQLFFDVAREEELPGRNDIVVAHTWWFTIFGLATLMVIQGVVPDLPDQTLVVEQTIATLWAGVQVVPRLAKSAVSKRSARSRVSR
ncbi:MAG TPA: TetR/AcrR family transcriptional regulator [Acidobacteriaceae bacterium]|jgi:AcrR family transcriptional regulator|nr:TetR/AcrR family transcriptional regulator [Acidobacteriaceae bacterium]